MTSGGPNFSTQISRLA